ncbi:MAG: TRAP transporter large permease subunit [Proteobacteria bacterium]|nr:TRAP transporter large permease subunit [Pseudomonadota bacterium]
MVTLAFILCLAAAVFGMPLFVVIGSAALVGFVFVSMLNPAVIFGEMYRLASAPGLITLPLFIFAGYILAESKAPIRLVNITRAFFGWMPGGVSIVALVACAIFTALTGASGVTIIALGAFLYPALREEGYDEKFTLGLLTCGGSLGFLFPPALSIIIYGVVSQVSVDQLFIAGIIPGIVLVLILSAYGVIKGLKFYRGRVRPNVKESLKALKDVAFEIPIPIIILGGIYSGLFTASESAAVTAFYVILVEVLIKRDIKVGALPKIMVGSMLLVGAIFLLIGTALGLTNFLIDMQIPMKALAFIQQFVHSKLTFLLILNLFLLMVGGLMEIFSAIIVIVPLIIPIAHGFGINPIHLGIIFIANLEIGYLTPPFGINLYISSFRFQQPIGKLFSAALPFVGILIIALMLITYIPQLSLLLIH